MHAKNLFVNDSCNWKTVKTVSEGLPKLDVVSSLALIVEPINSVNAGTLMISSE